MANITQEQLNELVRTAPAGKAPKDIVRGLLARGHTIEGLNADKQAAVKQADTRTGVVNKIADFLGIEKLGRGIGATVNNLTGGTDMVAEGVQNLGAQQDKLAQAIRAKKARGEDTTRLERVQLGAKLTAQQGAADIADIGTGGGLTNKEVLGSAALLGINLAAGGTLGAAGKATVAGAASGAAAGGVRGAITGGAQAAANTVPTLGRAMKIGAGVGAASGAAVGLEQDGDAQEIMTSAALGGLIGAGIPLATKLVGLGIRGTAAVTKAGYRGTRNIAEKTVEAAADKIALGKRATIAQQAGRAGEAQALRTGVDAQVVDFIQTAQGADKSAFKKMYDLAQAKKGNMRLQVQPKEIVGQTVLDRVTHLVDANKKAGEGISKAVQAMNKKPLDITKEYGEITKLLQSNGVGIKNGKVYAVGRVADSDLPYYQKMLDYVRPDKGGKVVKTAQYIDERRGLLFDELQLAKSRQQPYTEKVDIVAEQYRSILMRPLEAANPAYKEQNKLFAETIVPLQKFIKLIGYKGRLQDINTKSLRTAEVAQRLLGNAADRPTEVLTAIENAALNTGYRPQTSVFDQILFSDLLENYFGTTQTRSLRGQVSRAGVDTAGEAVGAGVDAARGNVLGLISRGARFLVGNTDDDQIKALGQLLADELGTKTLPKAAPRAAGAAAYTQKAGAQDITKGLRNVPEDILQMLK